MEMTHYMELIATNQPWNLIVFMAIPVIFAETLAISEFYRLFFKSPKPTLERINKIAGITLGLYFIGIFLFLFATAVVPITAGMDWRGPFDIIAVGAYLSGVIPLGGIALMELGILGKNRSSRDRIKLHVFFISLFLVVAHVAMIFGMLSPELTGGGSQMGMFIP